MLTRDRSSVYVTPPGMPAGTIYGVLPGQRILGYAATISAWPLDDEDPQALDALMVPIRRGDACIHISGLDMHGTKTQPQYVREIGVVRYQYDDRDETEVSVIARGGQHLRGATDPYHHAEWGPARSFVTLAGIQYRMGVGTFGPMDVIECIIRVRPDPHGTAHYLRDEQHVSAARRLLEGMVGVSRPPLRGPSRVGRWHYRWEAA